MNDATRKVTPLLDDFRKTSAQANGALAHLDAAIAEDRPDLRGAFPDLAGEDRTAFLEWVRDVGAAEEPLLARMIANGSLEAVQQESHLEPRAGASAAGDPSAPLRGGSRMNMISARAPICVTCQGR